ncbi:phosphoribosylformylglycinamidine cyclo-ligase [Rubrobacter aplysinae]|uniref:phosphoribosylformylglycinamidine cyclo-ligase n=1 Tax=Rubrobacter aplysinae TaxID=909625 RepID=UPI00064C04B9|nr:phosphoribosylformylglycinamidine cyclo-ligase [Rubrobacter aplysinae]
MSAGDSPRDSYEKAGVSIDRGERAVELMKESVAATHGPRVVSGAGGFAGLYSLAGYTDPVLASTIDGVGTKVMVARETGRYASIGTDIANHCMNDVLATGARPVMFLDYVASGRLDPEAVAEVVRGAADACGRHGVALMGGETAEMPGLYGDGDFDVVGCCIGACERTEALDGSGVRPGDEIVGLAASGLHTNGYTLARKVVADAGLSWKDLPEALGGRTLGEEYLEPHRAYVREVETLRGTVEVRALAHVTGGGIQGNLPRVLGGLGARIQTGSWEEPGVFGMIRSLGRVPEAEMRRVFNLGVGMCAVVPQGEAGRAVEALRSSGCRAWRIGEVLADAGVEFV